MKILVLVLGLSLAASIAAAQPPGGGQRQLTPEQRAALEAKREAEMKAPRPIEALDSVWMEDLTWMEVRDAIAGGKTTAVILTGGVESNGPYLATGKHNFILKVMGESIARKLGNALVAPIVTLEPGRPDGERVAPGSVFLSQATYRGVLTDMAESLRGMGFTQVILMGDSGGNQKPMQEVVATLNAKYAGKPARFFYTHVDTAMTHRPAKIVMPVGPVDRIVCVEVLNPRHVGHVIVVARCAAATRHILARDFGPDAKTAGDSLAATRLSAPVLRTRYARHRQAGNRLSGLRALSLLFV